MTIRDIIHRCLTTIGGDSLRVNVVAGSTASTEYTEDAAAAANPVGSALMLVREDARAGTLVSADGDNVAARGNNKGEQYVIDTDSLAQLVLAVASLSVLDDWDDGSDRAKIVGAAAHDAAIAGNPVRVAGRALTADYTAVAAGDVADLITTLLGKLVVYPFANPNQSWNYAAASGGIVNTTGVTIKAAAGAGVRNYITDLHVINGHATVSTDVQIRDGASGTVLWRGFAQAAGGGISVHFTTPLKSTANTLLEVACGTTGSAVYVNASGFTAAE